MGFFIDKHNRRKSTILLTAFCVGFLFALFFVILSLLLAEPLYQIIHFETVLTTTIIHSLLISLLGTPICCATFLLKDKRIAPYSFAGLAVWLGMFYAAAFLLESDSRIYMAKTITMFGLAPAAVGNLVTWPNYLRMKRANPTMNHRKTIREELKEAVAQEAARHPEPAEEPAPASAPEPALTEEEAAYIPAPGDYIYFRWRNAAKDVNVSHVGIVSGVSEDKLTTVEGNAGGAVANRSYVLNDDRIVGYGKPRYDAAG